jgi:hypothetical protein
MCVSRLCIRAAYAAYVLNLVPNWTLDDLAEGAENLVIPANIRATNS